MDLYKVNIINEYWLKQLNKNKSCPNCKIGKLVYCISILCDNCGKSPVKWLIIKK